MRALLVVDAQNEFSAGGLRPVPNHAAALAVILRHVAATRKEVRPIAWIRHHNRPHESAAFFPNTWGAELSPGCGVQAGFGPEAEFTKDVYGAFTGTDLETWLQDLRVSEVLIVGFYTHGCVATTVREAIVRGYGVLVDPEATGARAISDSVLGGQSADEVQRTALLHVVQMGARVLAASGRETEAPIACAG